MPESTENAPENQQENQPGNETKETKSYTPPASQDELDRIVENRLNKERAKYADYDELKQAKTKYDEHLESQKTEQQKAIDDARGDASTEVTQKFLTKLVRSEVKTIASVLGFNDPTDAFQVLGEELPVKDDEPDTDAIKALVEKLATDKPYLVAEPQARPPRTRPKPKPGEKQETKQEGKGKAAAALRQLGASRKSTI
ncbi:hypothetical protein [Agreia sp. COWG]|uniref:hypothetical protein n=1 Tax=Agreia sp. COWG TaxID=2773266 RepID=UPI0019283D57|nr:hypothetical protein [Agreia sp. COWG]CAD5999285.1 conserved protein of unknown function [Agreia sp. COWG]